MPETLAQLDRLLTTLEADRPQVSRDLRQAASALRSVGPIAVADNLAGPVDWTGRYETLCRALQGDTAEGQTRGGVDTQTPLSLATAREVLESRRWREANRAQLQFLRELKATHASAVPVVAQLSSLADAIDPELAGPSSVAELSDRWTDFFGAEGALQALRALIEDPVQLSDDDWEACLTRVRNALGTETAVAVSRGRLQRVTAPQTDP